MPRRCSHFSSLLLPPWVPQHRLSGNSQPRQGTTCSLGRVISKEGQRFPARSSMPTRAPASYGHLLTTVVTDQQTGQVHHTEYTMPKSGLLFANDHVAARSFIFDLRRPLQPK